jgi:AraC family transcriptional regulator
MYLDASAESRVVARTCAFGLEFLEVVFPEKHFMPTHQHGDSHFALILGGAVEHQAGRDRVSMTEKSACYIPVGDKHSDLFLGNARVFEIMLEGSRHSVLGESCAARSFHRQHPAAALLTSVYREFRNQDAYTPVMLESLTVELLVSLHRQQTDERAGERPRWLDRARDMLHDEFSQNLRLEHIACEVGVHPAHLTKAFRQRFGVSIGEYMRQLRIAKARNLLEFSDLQIGEIAITTGFADQAHFTRTFKKYTGQTPTSCRGTS